MLQTRYADLHIHTCLSPCANLDMTPKKIIREAVNKELSIIAITDHNSAENIKAVISASADTGIYVIPGMEISSSEEIHILALFESIDKALLMQDIIFKNLQPGENDDDLFGIQVIANEFDEVEGFNKRLLITATSLKLNEIIDLIHKFNGLAIAAHIDREAFSIINQIGFIPEDLEIDGIEISGRIKPETAKKRFAEYNRYPFIQSSDAHSLEDLGTCRTGFHIKEKNFNEIRMAFNNSDGREIILNRENIE